MRVLLLFASALALQAWACSPESGNRGSSKVNPAWADQKDDPFRAGQVPGETGGAESTGGGGSGTDQDELPPLADKDSGVSDAPDAGDADADAGDS